MAASTFDKASTQAPASPSFTSGGIDNEDPFRMGAPNLPVFPLKTRPVAEGDTMHPHATYLINEISEMLRNRSIEFQHVGAVVRSENWRVYDEYDQTILIIAPKPEEGSRAWDVFLHDVAEPTCLGDLGTKYRVEMIDPIAVKGKKDLEPNGSIVTHMERDFEHEIKPKIMKMANKMGLSLLNMQLLRRGYTDADSKVVATVHVKAGADWKELAPVMKELVAPWGWGFEVREWWI